MKIEVDLNKRYLVFFGIIAAFALMGGVIAAVGHSVNEINWSEQIMGAVNAQNLIAQNAVFANGYCFGLTDCVASWAALGARIGAVTNPWQTSGGSIFYPGSISVNGFCIGTNCINHIDSTTKDCSPNYIIGVNFASQTMICSGGTTPVCTPGQTQCSGAGYQVCDSSGAWGAVINCPAGCSNGACIPSGIAGTLVWDREVEYPYGGRFVFLDTNGADLLVYPNLAIVNKQTGAVTATGAYPSGSGTVMDIAFDGSAIYSVGAGGAGVKKLGAYTLAIVAQAASENRFAVAVDDNFVYTAGSADSGFFWKTPYYNAAPYNPILEKRDKNSLAVVASNSNAGAVSLALDTDYIYTADAALSTVNKFRKSDLVPIWARSFGGMPLAVSVDSNTVCAAGALPKLAGKSTSPGWRIKCWDKNGNLKWDTTTMIASQAQYGCTDNCWGYALAISVNGGDVYTVGNGIFTGNLNQVDEAIERRDITTGNLVWQEVYQGGASGLYADIVLDGNAAYTSFLKDWQVYHAVKYT